MKLEDTLHNWNDLARDVVRKGVERVGFRGENVICVIRGGCVFMSATNPSRPVLVACYAFRRASCTTQSRSAMRSR
jgi:hypothetical protein